ncbi:MAG: hypothetical protein O2860_12015, partial [Chloroflexi bacterium]|nr:hypothetical protein [Chloroflexota bacterium]
MIENVIARPFPRKPAVAILGLLAAILVASLIGLQSAQASDVLHVPNDFNTIQAAVDAASTPWLKYVHSLCDQHLPLVGPF